MPTDLRSSPAPRLLSPRLPALELAPAHPHTLSCPRQLSIHPKGDFLAAADDAGEVKVGSPSSLLPSPLLPSPKMFLAAHALALLAGHLQDTSVLQVSLG